MVFVSSVAAIVDVWKLRSYVYVQYCVLLRSDVATYHVHCIVGIDYAALVPWRQSNVACQLFSTDDT